MKLRIWIVTLLLAVSASIQAQRGTPPPPRAAAPIDLTGYWVSLVTNEWRYRMLTPAKGDYRFVPLNDAARRAADAWDPAKDEAAGEQCKAYGAAAIMNQPTRLRITWENDNTLRVDTDAGNQTRLFHFGGSRPERIEPTWQGYSTAQWEFPGGGRGRGGAPRRGGQLKVVTASLKPGYLRKNGVPYSGNAVVTEYFARMSEATGDEYLSVTVIVEDPQYLTQPHVRSIQFKREPDGSKWNPTPCSAR